MEGTRVVVNAYFIIGNYQDINQSKFNIKNCIINYIIKSHKGANIEFGNY